MLTFVFQPSGCIALANVCLCIFYLLWVQLGAPFVRVDYCTFQTSTTDPDESDAWPQTYTWLIWICVLSLLIDGWERLAIFMISTN